MFFDGDLQSGINIALKEAKLVACFVRGTALPIFLRTCESTNCVKARTSRACDGKLSI